MRGGKIMKTIKRLTILISLILLSSCVSTTFDYCEVDNSLKDSYGNQYFMTSDNWKLEEEEIRIGEVVFRDKRYQLYSDQNKLYIQMKKKGLASKELNLFVSERIELPKLNEINDYKVAYKNSEYHYPLLDYYFKDSHIEELEIPYEIITLHIKVNHLVGVVYPMDIYKAKDNQMYIQNYQNQYVELKHL